MNCCKRLSSIVLVSFFLLPTVVAQVSQDVDNRSLGDFAREQREKKVTQGGTQGVAAEQPWIQPQAAPPKADSSQRLQIDPAKEADIRRLLEITNAKAAAIQSMEAARKSIRPLLFKSLPPGEYREKLIDLFYAKFGSKIDMQQFVEMALPIYDKYLSDDDIKGLMQFYGTPVGQKALSVLPHLTEELRAAGTKWGEGAGRQAMLEVLAEHPELKQQLEEATKAARGR